ncbi:MAG: allS 1 [Polaromonas sp.]|nr:allS 1 [Polaromonas sp.]
MLETVSLDNLRVFVAAVDEGSFSGAGRKLRRAQSLISQNIRNLEAHIGVTLFDRASRLPVLTPEGKALLADARRLIDQMNAFKAKAKEISNGLEPELTLAVDVLFPMAAIATAAQAFAVRFPVTPLRVHVDALGGVAKRVLDGDCSLGVIGSLPDVPHPLVAERLAGMLMVRVASAAHPLALRQAAPTEAELAQHTQLILTDSTKLSEGRQFGVLSANVWTLGDLSTKRFFLLAGLGWGAMPMPMVEEDIAAGRLVLLDQPTESPGASGGMGGAVVPMSVVYSAIAPPGPAGRWMVDKLRRCAEAFEAGRGTAAT